MKAGWRVTKLGEVCEIIMGQSPDGESYNTTGEGVPLINGPVEFSKGSFGNTVKSKFTTQPTKFCKIGDLILCVRGSKTGKMNIAGFDACIGRGVAAIRAKQFQPWINHFISSKRDEIHGKGTGATFPNVSGAMVADFEICMPPIPEQQRIVTLLDEAFEGISTAKSIAERNLQNARAIFESHLDAVLSRSGAGYTATTLGAEVDLLPGYAFPSGGYTDAIDAVRLFRGDNIMQGYFRWEEAKGWPSSHCESYSRFALQEGDVVIAMDRPWVKAGLKRAQICEDDLPSLLVQRTSRLRTLGRMRMNFLSHLTGSHALSRHLLEVQTGIGVPHISGKQIESFKFMLPPLSDQESIANTLNDLLANTQRLEEIYEEKLTALDELKKSLLHRAFSGDL